MSKNMFILFIIIIFLLTIFGCSNTDKSNTIDVTPSNANLTIGVVGNFPKVNEKNITFKQYKLEQLNEKIDPNLDALFIMPDHLKEAAEPQFAELYKKLPYPTFFIGSESPVYAYINEDVTYETAYSGNTQMYTRGYFNLDNEKYLGWEFGLYNDVKNEENIKAMYTDVFETINKLNK